MINKILTIGVILIMFAWLQFLVGCDDERSRISVRDAETFEVLGKAKAASFGEKIVQTFIEDDSFVSVSENENDELLLRRYSVKDRSCVLKAESKLKKNYRFYNDLSSFCVFRDLSGYAYKEIKREKIDNKEVLISLIFVTNRSGTFQVGKIPHEEHVEALYEIRPHEILCVSRRFRPQKSFFRVFSDEGKELTKKEFSFGVDVFSMRLTADTAYCVVGFDDSYKYKLCKINLSSWDVDYICDGDSPRLMGIDYDEGKADDDTLYYKAGKAFYAVDRNGKQKELMSIGKDEILYKARVISGYIYFVKARKSKIIKHDYETAYLYRKNIVSGKEEKLKAMPYDITIYAFPNSNIIVVPEYKRYWLFP